MAGTRQSSDVKYTEMENMSGVSCGAQGSQEIPYPLSDPPWNSVVFQDILVDGQVVIGFRADDKNSVIQDIHTTAFDNG